MKLTYRQIGAWSELTAIARSEIILDKIESMLAGLEIPREEWPWLVWEQLSEQNGEALQRWLEETDAEYLWFLPLDDEKPSDSSGG